MNKKVNLKKLLTNNSQAQHWEDLYEVENVCLSLKCMEIVMAWMQGEIM